MFSYISKYKRQHCRSASLDSEDMAALAMINGRYRPGSALSSDRHRRLSTIFETAATHPLPPTPLEGGHRGSIQLANCPMATSLKQQQQQQQSNQQQPLLPQVGPVFPLFGSSNSTHSPHCANKLATNNFNSKNCIQKDEQWNQMMAQSASMTQIQIQQQQQQQQQPIYIIECFGNGESV